MDLSIKMYTPPPLSVLKSPALLGHFISTVLIYECAYTVPADYVFFVQNREMGKEMAPLNM